MTLAVDHLVIGANGLAQGVAWCEAALGITPGAGGQHPLMGTHNRLFSIASAAFPGCYAEIIAIDPAASQPARPRWFGLDQPALQEALRHAPRLLAWAARTPVLDDDRARMLQSGFDPGPPLALSRATASGVLRWRLTVRDDGESPAQGALPSLIEWQGTHPAESLPASGVSLQVLSVRGVAVEVAQALSLQGVRTVVEAGPPWIEARLLTSLGALTLHSSAYPYATP